MYRSWWYRSDINRLMNAHDILYETLKASEGDFVRNETVF